MLNTRIVRVILNVLGFSAAPPVQLEVIGAGLARTGTSSLQSALSTLLGGAKVHHFENLIGSSAQQAGWTALRDPSRRDEPLLQSLVAGHAAAVDVPAALHYKALMKAFPKAKVILTVHPKGAEGWYRSMMNSIAHVHYDVLNVSWIGRHMQPFKGFHVVGRHVYLDNEFFLTRAQWLHPSVAKRKYEQHNAEVRRSVPRSRLLVYSVDQGWGPLCKFLDVPASACPTTPFPKVNDTSKLRAAAWVLWLAAYVLPVAAFRFVTAVLRVWRHDL